MWSDDNGPYQGKHYQLQETLCSPAPIQRPRPPILIGGGGERKTLRLVAEYADACNLFGTDPDVVTHKLEVLEQHCRAVGRDPAEIKKTLNLGSNPLADPDGFLASMERYAQLGVTLVMIRDQPPDPVAAITQIGETIIPRLNQISA
jgi:hypothetical protein